MEIRQQRDSIFMLFERPGSQRLLGRGGSRQLLAAHSRGGSLLPRSLGARLALALSAAPTQPSIG